MFTDLDKVSRGLSICSREHRGLEDCSECPYKLKPGHYAGLACWCRLCDDALALLKAREPRVMTLDEVREDHDRVVWIECDASKTMNIGQYRGQTYWHDNCATKWERFVTMSFADDYLHRRADKYGKKWRCWTACPDEQVRRDTPWEGGEAE